MGIGLKFSDSRSDAPMNGDPVPSKFCVLEEKIVKGNSILLVRYDGCTTFAGKKLLLLDGRWDHSKKLLDPHLLGEQHQVKARFEPNEQGWRFAELCALEF